jgi:hypothetical protein
VRQVGHLPELYRDARSTKHKTITATAATATDTMIMMTYTGYEEHLTKTRISHLVFIVDTEIMAKTKKEPQNQLKTLVSTSITDSDLKNVEILYLKRGS